MSDGCHFQSDCIKYKMAGQPGTFFIFLTFFSGDLPQFNKKATILKCKMMGEDTLAVDCYDYDSGSVLVSLLQLIEEGYWPKVSK